MTYGELKNKDFYINADDIELCINGEEIVDEMYYPYELDFLNVVGIGFNNDNTLLIDLICINWKDRFEADWIAQ